MSSIISGEKYDFMNNPFTSFCYTTIWLKHFANNRKSIDFDFLEGVSLLKMYMLPIYYNIGKNLTKGINYGINSLSDDYKGKVVLLYDVPSYFNIDSSDLPVNLEVKSIFQYQGFLMNLENSVSSEDYIKKKFSSKNRREFTSNIRRLESCFNIEYSFYYGEIETGIYDELFKKFHSLLTLRFLEKQTNYHHLNSRKWAFYTELVYAMILEKQASLLVIYNDKDPIGITLNFHSEKILFESITVYDPDYYKFSIGKISIIKLLEWCFSNNIKISDFSKGDFEYKRKWSNITYNFDYKIIYDNKSNRAKATAKILILYLKFKEFLRSKNINVLYRKSLFNLNSNRTTLPSKSKVKVEDVNKSNLEISDYNDLDTNSKDYSKLKRHIFSFLYANSETESSVKAIKIDNKTFFILGKSKAQKVTFC